MTDGWSASIKDDLAELFGATGACVSAESGGGGGSLWSTYFDGCTKDIEHIDSMRRVWARDPIHADDAVKWVEDTRRDAAAKYNACLTEWHGAGGFAKDLPFIDDMEDNEDNWFNEVWSPIRHDAEDTAESKVLKSWHGPGAQAYAQVLQKQTTAMAEYANLARTSEGWMLQINNTVKGIAMGAKNYVASFNSSIADAEDSEEYIGVRASIGFYNFGYLEDWLTEVKDGDWTRSFDRLKIEIQDGARETSFKEGKWPEAKADISEMSNGDGGLGDQQPELPPAQDPGQGQGQDPTPEQGGDVDTHGTDERDGTDEFHK